MTRINIVLLSVWATAATLCSMQLQDSRRVLSSRRSSCDQTLACLCVVAARPFAGFFLFLGLAYYFYYHPPTPLAVTAEHMDGLWHELATDFQALHIGDKAHALTHSLTDKVSALEGRLSHALTDNLHSIQDSLHGSQLLHRVSDGVHSVSHALSDNLHSIQDQWHAVQGSLQHGLHAVESQLHTGAAHLGSNFAGLQAALKQQLRPIVQWPTPRWPVSTS